MLAIPCSQVLFGHHLEHPALKVQAKSKNNLPAFSSQCGFGMNSGLLKLLL